MDGGNDHERLRRGDRVLFVSDVHLSPDEPEVFVRFCRFLRDDAAGARALYILGDLFDFWIGRRQASIPGYGEVFRRIRALRDEGTEVFFIQGNRDYMLTEPFAAAHGIRVLSDVAEIALGERRVLLTHGDLLCTRDLAYHRMRRVIRSRPARALLSALPMPVALRIAGGVRRASGTEVRQKSAYVLDPDFGEIKAWLGRGFDTLIFGHVHKGEQYRVRLDGREADVFVLASWEDVPNWVLWDGGELSFVRDP
jgi:UDP-2,3-diacylglucosamine hydrolase